MLKLSMASIAILVVVVVVIVAGYHWWRTRQVAPSTPQWQDRQRVEVQINGRPLTVEVVTLPESITLGLGGRQEIGADGMLFILPQRQQTSFWMKGMLFDLDLIWIKDYQVVDITRHVPAYPLTTPSERLPLYPSPTEIDMVLEVPADKADEWQIMPGANLELK